MVILRLRDGDDDYGEWDPHCVCPRVVVLAMCLQWSVRFAKTGKRSPCVVPALSALLFVIN